MAKTKEKKEKPDKKKSMSDKKRLDISAKAIVDNIVFSKTEAWAYYRLSNSVYDFLSRDSRIATATRIINAYTSLINDRQEPLECHLIVASTPIDVDAWEEQVVKLTKDWSRAPGFFDYVEEQGNFLRKEEYLKKVTYLGINLGKRGALNLNASTFVESGLQGAKELLQNWFNTALQVPTEEISMAEEKETRRKEEDLNRILSTGNLRAERCTAEELLLLIKRQFYPAMPVPYLDVDHDNRMGPGDLELELHSAIHNKLRWLEINQMIHSTEVSGYRAALSISKLPKQVKFPEENFPFMYFLHKATFPFTSYARFTLHPTGNMKRKLEKKKQEQKDELENLAAGGNTADAAVGIVPTDVKEALQDMSILNDMLAGGTMPWVEGSYRIIVEVGDEKLLKKFCALIKQIYTDQGINLNWTVGDQADLFLEQMPGDRLRSTSHKQLTDLVMFGTSGFSYSSDVGDLVYGNDSAEGAVM